MNGRRSRGREETVNETTVDGDPAAFLRRETNER